MENIENRSNTSGAVCSPSAAGGKYLTFRLDDEEYGIEITKVVEIIKLMEITQVPRTPDYVRGVINLRGKVIPVSELRKKFGMDSITDMDETCIIVVSVEAESGQIQTAILVDTVSEVRNIESGDIEPPPAFGSGIDTSFILGMAKAKDAVTILLDIDRVMGSNEAITITQV